MIPAVQLYLNSRIHSATQMSPIFALMGQQYSDFEKPPNLWSKLAILQSVRTQLDKLLDQATMSQLGKVSEQSLHVFKVGDLVLYRKPAEQLKTVEKYENLYAGPFKVISVNLDRVGAVTGYRIQLVDPPGTILASPRRRLRRYYPPRVPAREGEQQVELHVQHETR
jgi:hypothetical protein